MRSSLQGVLVSVLLILPAACTAPTVTPTQLPAPTTTAVASIEASVSASATVPTATASAEPTATPSPTPTLDATRSAAMTVEAIRVAVTASGVPEGSTEFDAQVAATQCALIPPATATPLPWPLAPQQPYLVSRNCLGTDLPGQAARVWQAGAWIEAEDYLFTISADLEVARQRYLAYLDAISLLSGPPGNDFPEILAQHMNSTGLLPAPESCLSDEITSRVNALAERGQYVRLTLTEPLQWAEFYHLFVSVGDIELALPWSTTAVRQELLAVETGKVVKTDTLSRFAGTALMTWDSNSGQWFVADDDGGYYCNNLAQFVD